MVFDAGDIDYGIATTSLGKVGDPPVGFYQFTNLDPDSNPGLPGDNPYIVEVVSMPVDAGTTLADQTADPQRDGVPSWDSSIPGLPPADNQDTGHFVDLDGDGVQDPGETGIYVTSGTTYAGADFGYEPEGVIGDYVWIDLDNDGFQDPGEMPLSGVVVTATNVPSGGTTTLTTTTDSSGLYSFANLPDGDWTVSIAAPAGMFAGARDDASLQNGTGSVGDVSAVVSIVNGEVVSLVSGAGALAFDAPNDDDNVKIDFGLFFDGPNTLSGTVVLEDKAGGLQDGNSGEPTDVPVAGTTVFLLNSDGLVIGSTLTDANGDYSFSNLPNDTYTISMVANDPLLSHASFTTDDYAPGSLPAGVTATDNGGSALLVVPVTGDVSSLDFAWVSDVDYDFGDLPNSYATSLQGDGARHIQQGTNTLYLGASVDAESDASSSATATGDDASDGDDEDGVVLLDSALWGEGNDPDNQLQITVQGDGWLVAWMDFDGDGSFLGPDELIINQAVSTGATNYQVSVPAGTFTAGGAQVASRFRLFPTQPLVPEFAFAGVALDGEVEDYVLSLGTGPPAYTILKTVTDVGGDGASGVVDASGDVISYSIVVTNTGGQDITNVVLSDALLTGANGTLNLVPVESGTTNSILEIGETFTYTGTYTVQQSDIDDNGGGDGDIDNTASVVSTEITTPQTDSTETPITQLPAYTILKTVTDVDGQGASGVVDAAGDVISYSIVITNTGNLSITNVVMDDPLLSGANGTLITTPVESGTVDSILSVGETFTYTGTYTVQQSVIDDNGGGDGDIDNIASVVSGEITTPQTSSTETPITQAPAYTIVKSV
ncbi:MAG: SdrD B-like domain-containing protein, partial [Luminiphilus sp.]